MEVIAGVAYEAMASAADSGRPKRTVDRLPGFKNTLISQIRVGLLDDSWIERRQIPAWWLGYIALVSYYPDDVEVETLIVDSMAALPDNSGDFLEFLTLGKFDSARVTELRYRMAMDARTMVALKAIRGIGQTRPEGGLEVLQQCLARQGDALAEVFEAFAAYGDMAIPYLPMMEARMAELGSGGPSLTNLTFQRMQDAVNRVSSRRDGAAAP